MTKIVVFGLPYSRNLGDGVISDCLQYAIRQYLPDAEVHAVDISGRRDQGQVVVGNRTLKLLLLRVLPKPLRQYLVTMQLKRLIAKAIPQWRDTVRGADAAFIGGGQLFSDADLNFCLKIAAVSDILQSEGIPVAVHAVGVARNWSTRGTELFRRVLATDLRWIGLRDRYSRDAWRYQFAEHTEEPEQFLVRDPGLLAEDTFGRGLACNRIGLCVTSPVVLSYHSDSISGTAPSLELFASVIDRLCTSGCQITMFCNGAEEDQSAIEKLIKMKTVEPWIATGDVEVAKMPSRPKDLAHLISSFQTVVAHRLHACILSYAYGGVAVGLGWDQKVESFFASIDRSDLFLPANEIDAEMVASAVLRATERRLEADELHGILTETQSGVNCALKAVLGSRSDTVEI